MAFKTEQLSDDVTLYCGDCREIIPTLSDDVNAVVSDPPYGIEELVTKYTRSIRGVKTSERLISNDKNLDCVAETIDLITKRYIDIWLVLFYSCRISPTFFQATFALDYFGEIIWDKKVMGMGTAIRYQHENIAIFKWGEPEQFGDCSSVLTYLVLKGENKVGIHPHEKPLQVMNNICRVVPGKVILDPFMGTGSTGAAAVQLRRGFVGIEVEQKYYDMARKKISEAMKQEINFWEK